MSEYCKYCKLPIKWKNPTRRNPLLEYCSLKCKRMDMGAMQTTRTIKGKHKSGWWIKD